jgi:tetratricopeptide (TPR) repeat protein
MYDQLLALYLARNQMAEAEQTLKEKVANNPKQALFYIQLASFYLGTKRPAEMETTLQRLISNPADFPQARLILGQFFFRIRDLDRARREFETGMQASKDKAPYQKAMVELYFNQGKYQEAKALVTQLLKDNPKDTQAVEYSSALALQTGDPAQIQTAVNDLQGLVTKSPDNPVYRFELGRALMAKASKDPVAKGVLDPSKSTSALARVQLEESILLRPDFIPAKLMLAQLYNTQHDSAKALQYADDVLRADPNNVPAKLSRTAALSMMGELEKAKTELDQLLKVAPNLADARFQLGMINFQEKKFKEADSIFRQLQDSNPGDSRGLIGMVETQVAQSDFNSAITTMQAQLTRDPNRQDYRRALANILTRAQRYDEAISNFKQLVDKNPNSSDLNTSLGEVYRLKGDLNSAMEHFRKATKLDPNDPVPMIRLALLLDGLGRRDEAKPLYEQVLRVKTDDPVALNNLAYIKAEEGRDLDQALTLAQRAKRALPLDPNISDTLGWIYIKKNLSDDAINIFTDLVAKEPKNPTYRLHLAMALFQKGDRPKARKECATALQSNPSKEEAGKIQELLQKLG